MSFYKYKELYIRYLPLFTIYPTIIGIDVGCTVNKRKPDKKSFDIYSNVIGYTSIGIATGIIYPISYPLLGCYVLYKTRTDS